MEDQEKITLAICGALIVAGLAFAGFCIHKAKQITDRDNELWMTNVTPDQD